MILGVLSQFVHGGKDPVDTSWYHKIVGLGSECLKIRFSLRFEEINLCQL